MVKKWLFTSESVTEGHPDKLCDQISDAVLDAILARDPNARVGCETFAGNGFIHVAGEITTKAQLDYISVVRDAVRQIGYTNAEFGLDADKCAVHISINRQSPDIAQGVDEKEGKEQGAGDQGMMNGYATNETPEFMPLPIVLAHGLVMRLAEVRKNGILKYLRPDGKSQVTVEYLDRKPARVDTIVLAAQHNPDVELEQLKKDLMKHVIMPVCNKWIDNKTIIIVNGTGKFVLGGPHADTGLTGRKIIVDTYGGFGGSGGGCLSGKDPSKPDRSATYMARYICKNVVAAGLADEISIQISYVIGQAQPISVYINTYGTNKIPEDKILELIKKHFPLTPKGIINHLQLRRPIYRKTAAYGHFGRTDPDFTWEKTDMAEALRNEAGL